MTEIGVKELRHASLGLKDNAFNKLFRFLVQ